jgi:DNA gyrase subunit A
MADIGKINQSDISVEMQKSYLDYAMSVIVARALPDVRIIASAQEYCLRCIR